MKQFYTILLGFLGALALIWGISALGTMVTPQTGSAPFTLFSEVVEEFASLDNDEEGLIYYDHAGRRYSEEEFDSILPSFYYRQLAMDGRLPDSIRGLAVDKAMLERESFIFVSHPAHLNVHATPLYFLLESMSKRVDLEMPSDVFRFTESRIEFVDMERNAIDEAKSELYQSMLDAKGVVFPIRLVVGNPTTRKPYDNGYLLVDAEDKLYQLKQTVGRPYLREIPLPAGVVPKHLFVTEYPSRDLLAFLVDEADRFYAITLPDYRTVRAELPPARMREERMTIFGNPFFWTVVQTGADGSRYTALDARTLKEVKHLTFETKPTRSFTYYILPFRLSFTSGNHNYLKPTIDDFSPIGLGVWLLIAVIVCVVSLRRRRGR